MAKTRYNDDNPILCSNATSIVDDELDKCVHSSYGDRYNTYVHPFETKKQLHELNKRLESQNRIENDSAMLLHYHISFNHISFHHLRLMAKQNIIPSRLQQCPLPVCRACMFRKATKRPWRTRHPSNNTHKKAKTPGQCVSVDMLSSPTPRFVAEMTGNLQTSRYKHALVFVYHASSYSMVYPMKQGSAEEALEAKLSFELHCQQSNINICQYHCDKGVFRANKWINDCRTKGQIITFAGVNAHSMNSVAERRIRLLQELTRASMFHAAEKWKTAISVELWPYALRVANLSLNETPHPNLPNKSSSSNIFTTTTTATNPKWHVPFGCPVYTLKNERANNLPFHKWKTRSDLGIYLGLSLVHSRRVYLVMNPNTRIVSPQFHLQVNDRFMTVKGDTTPYQWQYAQDY